MNMAKLTEVEFLQKISEELEKVLEFSNIDDGIRFVRSFIQGRIDTLSE